MRHRLNPFILGMAWLCLLCCCRPAAGRDLLFGVALEGLPEDATAIASLERELQLPVSLVNLFLQWPAAPDAGAFPLKTAQAVAALGATLILTWEPMFSLDGQEVAIPAEEIVAGRWDGYITHFAEAAAAWGGPCIIRFGHEMNLQRYHWGTTAADYGPGSPARYRLMFRHVVTKVRQAGAANIVFAFCPNIDSIPSPSSSPDAAWNTASAYYPGDAYVDVLGMDGYNWGTTQTVGRNGWLSQWRPFEAMFAPLFGELRSLAPTKPVYIFETACVTQGGDKIKWLREMAATAEKWQLAGLIWFQVNKELDWRLLAGIKPGDLEPLRSAR